jgi:hypothetical protein
MLRGTLSTLYYIIEVFLLLITSKYSFTFLRGCRPAANTALTKIKFSLTSKSTNALTRTLFSIIYTLTNAYSS